jgi:tetratricopeptide (TPR) repeat protein
MAPPPQGRVAPIPAEVSQAIGRAARRLPTAENLATLGVLDLVTGEPDRALQRLREALAARPEDPSLLNDVGVALLASTASTAGGAEPRSTFAAFEAIERSLHLRPSPAAMFNAAITLERLGLRAGAIAAWRRYLEEDSRSGWAQEAAERLGSLERDTPPGRAVADLLASPETETAAFGRNPWADRQWGERTLLARWAERALAGDRAGAETALAQAETIASALTETGGGRLLAASAAMIREAERSPDRTRLARLARGHLEFGRAFRLQRSERSGEAHELAGQAIDDLHAAGSPFELRARLLRASSAVAAPWSDLQLVEQAAGEASFPSLAAEARREAAYRMSLEGRLAAALEAYDDARRRFLELGEHEMAAVLAAMRAELFAATGNERLAMAELAQALGGAPAASDPWNRYSIYVVAAGTIAGEFRWTAVEAHREAAASCRELPERPLCVVDSLLAVAQLAPAADLAGNSLVRANALLARVPASDGRERTAIDLAMAQAQSLSGPERSAGDLEQAAELYAAATRRYQARALAPFAVLARVKRASILERLGDPAGSAAEYREALRALRLWDRTDRFRPENAEQRVPPDLRTVYERLLELDLGAAGDLPSRGAFLLSEEMRDRLAPRRSAELALPRDADLDRWLAALPAGTAVVEYALTSGRATAWILAGGRFEQVALAPRAGLAERLRVLASERDLPAWKHGTGALFRELVSPVLARLPAGTRRLVVVPDADLHGLPFRALWDPDSGHYLDEELAVSLAPSVALSTATQVHRPPAPMRGSLPVLSLGFAAFAPDLGLGPLPWAVAEAAAVNAVYRGDAGACPVADWASFRRCAPRAEVIHLATHAAAAPTASGSWLALPRETVSLDRLWSELPELPARPLIVLSSCQSVATAAGGEGLGGLARPFLASGARAVVGTLWEIDDEEAAAFFSAFHRGYRRSGDAVEALRTARELLPGWRERPWVWGGVEVVSSQ